MPMWLPPTPPSEDFDDFYVDTSLEMRYDTQSVIIPAVLAAIAPFSEEDYDVFGLRRQNIDSMPVKKVSKSSKQLKEHVNVPPSLFWRRFTADTLSTKLKRLASHQKKIKTKDQFTPLLEQQPEGPEWALNEDWILLKSINGVLEFPLSLTISVPAQIPNWSIVADITSALGRVRRSPLQCREHLMNVVIPREDGSAKVDEHSQESRKHKSKDTSYKKSKGRKEQRTKSLVLNNSKEHTRQYSNCFDRIIQASICRKQTPKFTWDTVQKPAMHSDLLKDYGIHMDSVLSPMQVAQQRADRIQSEHPRHNPMQPGQPYHGLSNVRSYPGSQFAKPALTGLSSSVPTSQRSNPSTTTFSPSKITTSSFSASSSATASTSSSMAATVVKTYSTTSAGVGDLSKTLSITRNLTSQQLLLLRQSTLQHQTVTTAPSTLSIQPLASAQSQAAVVQQKLSLPSGIEQLRATVASAMPRFAATSGGTVKGLSSGRTLQTEEVLALFKQQSMRMAATQSAQLTTKPSQVSSNQSATKSATITSSTGVGQGMSTTVAQNFKAQIQALAAQHKSPLLQTKLTSDKK